MGKLSGIRVIDMASFLPGPYLSLAMSDHGAEVIKVEAPPAGDHGRYIGLKDGAHTVFFKNINRGKKSVVLDLKNAADLERFYELVDSADVMIEANRPGVAARLKVDYATLSKRNPGLIYCAITAFGQDGPIAKRPAHDLAIQAMTGVLATNVSEDGKIALPALPIADYAAGLHGLAGVLMALYRRTQTGLGDYIDISMQEVLLASLLNVLGPTMAEGRQPNPAHERTTGGAALYRVYDTRDGRQLALGGQESKFINSLLGAIGRMELAPLCERPGPHQEPVVKALTEKFSTLTLAEATEFLDSIDVCWGPVKTFPEALDDLQVQARDFVIEDKDGIRHIGAPIRFSNEPAEINATVPTLGEHCDELLFFKK